MRPQALQARHYSHQLNRAPSAQKFINSDSPRQQQANLLDCLPPIEKTKAVGIDPTDPTKIVRILTKLPAK